MLTKPGLLQERAWKCLFGILIAFAGRNVNCPFPFPSDQGGHNKTSCRQVTVIINTWSCVSKDHFDLWVSLFSHQNMTPTGLISLSLISLTVSVVVKYHVYLLKTNFITPPSVHPITLNFHHVCGHRKERSSRRCQHT